MTDREDVTRLLVKWKQGDSDAVEALVPIVYRELHRLAQHYLRDERAAATLQPTALVNELYVRLVQQDLPDWESRSQFYGVAAHRMRQILVDHARQKQAAKRGAGAENVALDELVCFAPQKSAALIALDDALAALEGVDSRKAKVVELRFFGGLSVEETARLLDVSVGTIGREQRLAEAWLRREMARDSSAHDK